MESITARVIDNSKTCNDDFFMLSLNYSLDVLEHQIFGDHYPVVLKSRSQNLTHHREVYQIY